MRTKTLILSAVLSAAGIASSLAQVYSVNAVGYVNVTVPAGPGAFVAAGNPLNYPDGTNPANTLDNILPNAPNNTTKVWDFDPVTGNFALYTKRATGWSGAAGVNFNPGKGFFIQNDAATPITLTFVGEVPQGSKTVAYTAGFNLIASAFPLSGGLESFLGYPAVNGDKVYQFDPASQQYALYTRRATTWSPSEPTIGANAAYANVAEGFFLQAVSAGSWTRTFTVN